MLFFKIIGALTSKPFAFTFRSWELSTRKSVDFLDVLALDILVESRQHKIARVLPLFSYSLPKYIWLTDRIRHLLPNLNKFRLFKFTYLYKLNNKGMNRKYFNINNEKLLFKITNFLFNDNIEKHLDIVSNNFSFQNTLHLNELAKNASILSQFTNFQFTFDNKTLPLTRSPQTMYQNIPNFFSLTDCLCVGLDLRRLSPTFFIYLQNNLQCNNRLLLTFLSKFSSYTSFYLLTSLHGGSHINSFFQFLKGKHTIFNYTYLCSLFFFTCYNYQLKGITAYSNHLRNKYKTTFDIINVIPYNLGLINYVELGFHLNSYLLDSSYNALILNQKLQGLTSRNYIENTQLTTKTKNILYIEEPSNFDFDNLYYDFVIFSGYYWHAKAYVADLLMPTKNLLEQEITTVLSFTGLFKTTHQLHTYTPFPAKYKNFHFLQNNVFFPRFLLKQTTKNLTLNPFMKLFVYITRAKTCIAFNDFSINKNPLLQFSSGVYKKLNKFYLNAIYISPAENLSLPYEYNHSSAILSYQMLTTQKNKHNFDLCSPKFYTI